MRATRYPLLLLLFFAAHFPTHISGSYYRPEARPRPHAHYRLEERSWFSLPNPLEWAQRVSSNVVTGVLQRTARLFLPRSINEIITDTPTRTDPRIAYLQANMRAQAATYNTYIHREAQESYNRYRNSPTHSNESPLSMEEVVGYGLVIGAGVVVVVSAGLIYIAYQGGNFVVRRLTARTAPTEQTVHVDEHEEENETRDTSSSLALAATSAPSQTRAHAQTRSQTKVHEKEKKLEKKNKKLRLCPVCRAVLKKQNSVLVPVMEENNDTLAQSSFVCENPHHNSCVTYSDIIGHIIGATGGTFSVMVGAATSSVALSTIFSLIGGILFYKGVHIFKKLVKDDNDARKNAHLLEYNDPANIQQYCAKLSPEAQQNLNSVINDLEYIKKDYDAGRISERLYRDLCNNRGVWSLNKRYPQHMVHETIRDALLRNLAYEKSILSYALLRELLTIRNVYWHDRGCVAQWYNTGQLSQHLREYYDDCLTSYFYAREETFINLFHAWHTTQDNEQKSRSFAQYCQDTIGFDVTTIAPIDKVTQFIAQQILSRAPLPGPNVFSNELVASDLDPALFEEAETTHTIGSQSLTSQITQRILTYISPAIHEQSLYTTPQEWLENESFAQPISKHLELSDQVSYGQRAFRITKPLLHIPWFQEDNYIVVDFQHNIGLELFDSNGEWCGTTNFNGTKKHVQEPFIHKMISIEKQPEDTPTGCGGGFSEEEKAAQARPTGCFHPVPQGPMIHVTPAIEPDKNTIHVTPAREPQIEDTIGCTYDTLAPEEKGSNLLFNQEENQEKYHEGRNKKKDHTAADSAIPLRDQLIPANSQKHIFSNNHIKDGIFDLGKTKEEILNQFAEIIKKIQDKGLFKEGDNQIKTMIGDKKVEIRVHVQNSKILSVNGFIGHSEREMENAIHL